MKHLSILFLCCALWAAAQQPLVGTIKGVIKDKAGRPLADVALTAKNLDSRTYVREGATDTSGVYQLVELEPGNYSITAKKNGYRDFEVPLVTLYPGQHLGIPDITMMPGAPGKPEQAP